MAASCMGNFGTYKYLWSRHADGATNPNVSQDTVWVTKRYIPTDLRSTAPVPRHKLMAPPVKALPKPDEHWIPPRDPALMLYTRDREEQAVYVAQPSTRCEEWSTLRSMLPSRGSPKRNRPPNWGTGDAWPPLMVSQKQNRFPHINSPMTRYVDDMHLTNRLFKLH